jgi:hypothetical protein
MRIATWNLERPKAHGHAKNEACLGKLAEVDADLWILTETNSAIGLRGYHHQSSPSVAGYHRAGEHFTTLLSRWPLLRSIPTWDPLLAVCAELESPIGPMLLYGTIITYANDRGPTGSSRRWQEHRRSIERHQHDWVAFRRRFLAITWSWGVTSTRVGTAQAGMKIGNRLQCSRKRSGLRI